MSELPFVSVIVPARNAEATLRDCLASILRTNYPAARREVLVVDNASTDRTAELIRQFPVQHLAEPRRGPSAARNRGIEASRGEILAFTDADCVATTQWLSELVRGFDSFDTWGVAGEIVAFPPRTPAEAYTAARKSHWQRTALGSRRPFAITANVAFRRETFDRIGHFDVELLRAQDKDFGWRFSRAGDMKLAYRPRALVLHRHRSTGRGIFFQHLGWGYGAALLHAKYGLPWCIGHELQKYTELAGATRDLARAAFRQRARRADTMDVYTPWFEVLRRLGLRTGALLGLLDVPRRRRLRRAGADLRATSAAARSPAEVAS